MKVIKITPSKLSGSVHPPASKSLAHRAIICSMLSSKRSRIENIYHCEDIDATLDAAKAFGADIISRKYSVSINATEEFPHQDIEIDANESASTLRFLIPVAAALGLNCRFTGKEGLGRRPMAPILHCLQDHGVNVSRYQGFPISISGKLIPGKFHIPGNISSQFISGLLFALPLLEGDSKIVITTHIESYKYIQMTLDVLKQFNIHIKRDPDGFSVKGGQKYMPYRFPLEADWSQSANFIVSDVLGSNIKIKGLSLDSNQADRSIVDIMGRLGQHVRILNSGIDVIPDKIKAQDIDVSQCPDLLPILAVAASFADGEVFLYGAKRLRLKETDRLKATANALNSIGANIKERNDSLIINPVPFFKGGEAESYGDHRIIMALAMSAARSKEPIFIKNYSGINKSYPTFFDDFRSLGGKADVVDLGPKY